MCTADDATFIVVLPNEPENYYYILFKIHNNILRLQKLKNMTEGVRAVRTDGENYFTARLLIISHSNGQHNIPTSVNDSDH